jgi:hypothetical protein
VARRPAALTVALTLVLALLPLLGACVTVGPCQRFAAQTGGGAGSWVG